MRAVCMLLLHPRIFFEHGTISIADAEMLEIPDAKYDKRSKTLRSYGMHYADVIEYLTQSEIAFDDRVQNYVPIHALSCDVTLRDYQQDSVLRWKKASMRGCVILPTGAGKTAVGMAAICAARVPALVVVPTIDLLLQWADFLQAHLCVAGYEQKDGAGSSEGGLVRIGRLGGGSDDVCAVTVATYDSAYLRAPEIGNRFGLLVFDEVHHLPAPGYRSIAEQCVAPFRLGLTATLEREDGLHNMIPRLVGGVVYRRSTRELAEKKHLAKYDLQTIRVRLSAAEQTEYDRCRSEFLAGLHGLGMKSESMFNLKRLILLSNRSKKARAALLARNKANEIAFNTSAKIVELRKILEENCRGATTSGNRVDPDAPAQYREDVARYLHTDNVVEKHPNYVNGGSDLQKKAIIFTQNNKMAYSISDAFLMPIITHKTSKSERKEILDGFRAGKYTAIVTSRVLDEGVDVPDAELGIIVSGTGSGREMIQRLGRLLRPKKDGGRALLVEMISGETREASSSARRQAALNRSIKANNRSSSAKKQHRRTAQRPSSYGKGG